MIRELDEGIWLADSGREGPAVCISFGMHGNERAPIDAGTRLLEALESGRLALAAGRLLLVHANPRASAEDRRWSDGGVDLNRCFAASILARKPELFEERRAAAIVAALQSVKPSFLVDFHCTVEPGRRFLMQHPPPEDEAHRGVFELLSAEVLLCDPDLRFGGVSLDEWMSTRGRVGICYETGWKDDPENTPEAVRAEMENLLAGLGLVDGRSPRRHDEKRVLVLDEVISCAGPGFRWSDGIGENLQELPAGTVLGAYGDGSEERLGRDAALIFPKKRPELLAEGKPLVYLARRA